MKPTIEASHSLKPDLSQPKTPSLSLNVLHHPRFTHSKVKVGKIVMILTWRFIYVQIAIIWIFAALS
jgi:hypothetical protein